MVAAETFFNVDHMLYSTICKRIFHIGLFHSEAIVLCYLPTCPPQDNNTFRIILQRLSVYSKPRRYPSPIYNFKNNFNLDDQLQLQNQNYTRLDRLSILRFDYLGLISQNNVIPPQSHFAAIRFNIP